MSARLHPPTSASGPGGRVPFDASAFAGWLDADVLPALQRARADLADARTVEDAPPHIDDLRTHLAHTIDRVELLAQELRERGLPTSDLERLERIASLGREAIEASATTHRAVAERLSLLEERGEPGA